MAAPQQDDRLLPLLQAAEPRGPRALAKPDPGAALALAAHCCMLEAGFEVCPPAAGEGAPRATRASPAAGWDRRFPDEWVFEYTHPDKLGRFALHCSLQRASGRMLASAMETGAPRNHHMLGLQLQNYVPGGAAAFDGPGWAGVVARQGAVLVMIEEHVAGPLLAMASDLPESAPSAPLMQAGGAAPRGWGAWLPPPGSAERRYVLAAAAVAAAALAAGAVLTARRRRAGGGWGAAGPARALLSKWL
ncbi:MAG: hypothetical protein J3K34DRAFT_196154 [Monoraphidium minutum]|nr:MAG: hypothetical protein J3K34DRAFT_196154 [Monoraphidium minutum]